MRDGIVIYGPNGRPVLGVQTFGFKVYEKELEDGTWKQVEYNAEYIPKGERKSVKEYKVPSAAPEFTKNPPEGGSGEPSTKETTQEKSRAQRDEEELQALFESLENSSTEELPR